MPLHTHATVDRIILSLDTFVSKSRYKGIEFRQLQHVMIFMET
jgi:hypothetical protein